MTEEIVFYHNPGSRARMAHWMLEEAGAPYRIVPIDSEKGEHKTPSFLALNPTGKLPTIVDRGAVVTETAAIIADLADAVPEAGLEAPPGDPSRGAHYRWPFFGGGCFEPALLDTMLKRPPPERKTARRALKREKIFDDYVARPATRPALPRVTAAAAD